MTSDFLAWAPTAYTLTVGSVGYFRDMATIYLRLTDDCDVLINWPDDLGSRPQVMNEGSVLDLTVHFEVTVGSR